MAAPEYVPVPPTDKPRTYASPDHVPDRWTPDRPGDLEGRQPVGPRLGYQGPDQGYGLVLANRFRDRIQVQPGESAEDAIMGCLAVALKRASLFGRAPVVHDFTIAFTIWGFLDADPPEALVALRRRLFTGVANPTHHYLEWRSIADRVPDAVLRRSHTQVVADYPARWADLVGT
jgi:hypothetical protein